MKPDVAVRYTSEEQHMDRDNAAELLVKYFKYEVLDVARREADSSLQEGFWGTNQAAIAEWYSALSVEQKELLRNIVNCVTDLTMFRIFNVLDGTTGILRIDEKPYNFTIVLDEYQDEERYFDDEGATLCRINPPNQHDPMLHDLFQDLMDETQESE